MTTENELIHYGVPGMKWGVRKQRANERIARYKDSKALAIGMEAGKSAAVYVLANLGSNAVSRITDHPAVNAGAALVATSAQLTAMVVGIVNTVDIARTNRKGSPNPHVKRD